MKINLPTKFTIARIILIPFMIAAYLTTFLATGKLIALILFVVAAFTDFLDGYLARKHNMVTRMGKILDPIADKLLMLSALLLLVADNTIPAPYGVIFAILILGREFAVSALRQVCASKDYVISADITGKLKTVAQDIALPLYLFVAFLNTQATPNTNLINIVSIVAFVVLSISVLLSVISGIYYYAKNKGCLKN